MRIRTGVLFLVCAVALATLSTPLPAQEITRGSLLVRVQDATGAVIVGAVVSIEGQNQQLERETGDRGEALFSALTPGFYNVTVTQEGFRTTEIAEVEVRLERRAVTVTMEVGEVAQVVEVVGEAAGIDPVSVETGANISDTLYTQIPLARGLASAFYLAPGVSTSTGAGGAVAGPGAQNPTIGGASGLENMYLLDGVNVTHSGFGGFGTFTRVYGSLGSGMTTSFIKEVQVKTGAFEAQHGQALGGVLNVITKSGSNDFFGAVYGYYGPDALRATETEDNEFRSDVLVSETHGRETIDFGFEVGGSIWKDHLFYFVSGNPSIIRRGRRAPFRDASGLIDDRFTFGAGDCNAATNPLTPLAGCADIGRHEVKERALNYAIKLTSQFGGHSIEGSWFGDPSHRNAGPNRSTLGTLDPVSGLPANFSELEFGSINAAVRYNGLIRTNWLMNAHFGFNRNKFEEQFVVNDYFRSDNSVAGRPALGGVGFFENGTSRDKILSINNTNIFDFFGQHELTEGFYFSRNRWGGDLRRTGPPFPMPSDPAGGILPEHVGLTVFGSSGEIWACVSPDPTDPSLGLFSAAIQALDVNGDCFGNAPGGFVYRHNRGAFRGETFSTHSDYYAGYAQDNWQINKYITAKLGLRWEEEELVGEDTDVHVVFAPSWATRVGLIVDPFGERRTKIYFNYGRFFERIPNDISQRLFSGEASYLNLIYGANADKTVDLDPSNYITTAACPFDSDGDGVADSTRLGYICLPIVAGVSVGGAQFGPPSFNESGAHNVVDPNIEMQHQDEYVVGFEHEFGQGFVVGARYIDRRIRVAVEDINQVTTEELGFLLLAIDFPVANPSSSLDVFNNAELITYTDPSQCFSLTIDLLGTAPGQCFTAESGAFNPLGDGIADGFPDPIRRYRAVEISLNRRFRENWQFSANWRIGELFGNFEGSFRSDQGQTDPNLSSLFDFRPSEATLSTYDPGPLPTDRRHVVNAYGSYMFDEGWANGLNVGFGWRLESGNPITEYIAHPIYTNGGEIVCTEGKVSENLLFGATSVVCETTGRGGAGRNKVTHTTDFHADYPFSLGETFRVRLVADLFNIFHQQRNRTVDMIHEITNGRPNGDFLTKRLFQVPFNARFAVRLEW